MAQKIARVLNAMLATALACNLLILYLVPTLVLLYQEAGLPEGVWRWFAGLIFPGEDGMAAAGFAAPAIIWFNGWREMDAYSLALTLFLLFSGCCTAVILWQARRVLATIRKGRPFSTENAVSLNRSAVCCFLIAAAALARTAFSVWLYRSPLPLASYNALFVPLFAMAGLLCLVMAALFRQAAEMKAENDLTI